MKHDLLFEIGLEEIPARFMPDALAQMESLLQKALEEAFIPFENIKAYGTPRRLAVIATGVAGTQPVRTVENKGPSIKIAYDAAGTITKAAEGFARGQGVAASALVEKAGYVFAVKEEGGQEVEGLLPGILTGLVNSLNFPKTMRWSDLDFRFVRPIHWLLALFGEKIVPLEVAHIKSGNKTRGHRFLHEGEITIKHPSEYVEALRSAHVLADQEERRILIEEQVKDLAVKEGGQASIDEELLEEVTYLVEWPTALCGRFDTEFLALPKEAIITPMREHQRYFPVFDKKGALLPLFITVRNGGSFNLPVVAAGNERVLRARLADAAFFFNEDRKHPLADRLEKLKTVVFQEGLGSIYDKAQRLKKLSSFIRQKASLEAEVNVKELDRAAELAKADLVTGMVCEFTELQGIMGREYSKLDLEPANVSEAIFEHYLPRFAGDELPQNAYGRIVSISDKTDNIVATFSRGLIPSGSQDPYALRRQALGIVGILAESGYKLSLSSLLKESMALLEVTKDSRDNLLEQLLDFFKLRLKNLLAEKGLRYDLVDAVLAAGMDNIADTFKRAKALQEFAGTGKLGVAVQAFTRVANILKQAKEKGTVQQELFTEQAEACLCEKLSAVKWQSGDLAAKGDYLAILDEVAELAGPVNNFFESVMVMSPDEKVKNNRLALLSSVADFAGTIADLSKIVEE